MLTQAGRRGAVLVMAAAIAYIPALRGGFVFDDHMIIEGGRLLRGPLWRVWLTTTTADYWPLTRTCFWVQWRVWGLHAWGYHAVNILLHIAAAILVWRVLRRLHMPGAWIAGLLFAVHPATVESVAWISETKNTLSGVLFLGSILAWIRFDEEGDRRSYAISLSLFALAALAKASVVMLPLVLLGVALAQRGRLRRRDYETTAPFFAVALVAGFVNLWFQRHNAMAGGWAVSRGVGQRVGESAWALTTYLRNAFIPVRLGFVHEPWTVGPDSPLLFYAPLLAMAAALALLVTLRARSRLARAALYATGYPVLMLLPVLGVLDIAYFSVGPVSNHLQYLALIGPVALLGTGMAWITERELVTATVAVAVAVALGVVTFQRATEFENDLTLWTGAVRAAPGSAYAHNQLASIDQERGNRAGALDELLATARLSSAPADHHRYMGLWFLFSDRPSEAIDEAREVLRTARDPEARRDAAWVLTQTGQHAETLPVFRSLVSEAPNGSDYTYWLGAVLAREEKIPEAAEVLRGFCRVRPGDPQMEEALAILLVRLGFVDEAPQHAGAAAGVTARDPRAAAQLAAWIQKAGMPPL